MLKLALAITGAAVIVAAAALVYPIAGLGIAGAFLLVAANEAGR